MIFSVITQSGTKIDTLNNTIYQYSDNLTFQFLRDAKFNEYTLGAYINYDDKIYGLEVSEDDTFKVNSRFLDDKKEFLLSFSLTSGEEIIHLGTIKYKVKEAFGSITSPLPKPKEIWESFVEEKVDNYFLENYQSKLDDFNSKKTDFDTKYREVSAKAIEIESMKSSIDTTAQQVASNKSAVDQQAQNVVENVEAFKADYAKKVEAFDKLDAASKKEIQDLTASSKAELDTKKNEISTNLDKQYAQFDDYMNLLKAMGIVVVDGCLCMYDE